MTRIVCEVGAVVSLGGPAKHGVDWQVQRADGVTDISARYVIRTTDGALVEVQSDGMRHGPPEVMARLARGEPVAPDEYFFAR